MTPQMRLWDPIVVMTHRLKNTALTIRLYLQPLLYCLLSLVPICLPSWVAPLALLTAVDFSSCSLQIEGPQQSNGGPFSSPEGSQKQEGTEETSCAHPLLSRWGL